MPRGLLDCGGGLAACAIYGSLSRPSCNITSAVCQQWRRGDASFVFVSFVSVHRGGLRRCSAVDALTYREQLPRSARASGQARVSKIAQQCVARSASTEKTLLGYLRCAPRSREYAPQPRMAFVRHALPPSAARACVTPPTLQAHHGRPLSFWRTYYFRQALLAALADDFSEWLQDACKPPA